MSHEALCALYDTARAAVDRRDWKAADDARNAAYRINEPMAWFIAEEIGRLMADAGPGPRNSEQNPFWPSPSKSAAPVNHRSAPHDRPIPVLDVACLARPDFRTGTDRFPRSDLEARAMTDRETQLSPGEAIAALFLLAAACGAAAIGFAAILWGYLS